MKVLLTGITGNLGHEVSLDLARRGAALIPFVRPGKGEVISSHPVHFEEVVEGDLTEEGEIRFSSSVDCIVHCAGSVHFRDAGNKNEKMMLQVIRLAKKLGVPIYAVSTAFVYRPPGAAREFNNSYEKDKFLAEQALVASGIPHTIFRPSVLTGNSRTGEIQNFSGYYLIVRAFLVAIRKAIEHDRVLRFPRMTGESNMVPVDQAAEHIGKTILDGRLGETFYITNPAPPRSEWVLDETLKFHGVRNSLTILDIPFQEFGKLDLTEEEDVLYQFASHFSPYWSMEYEFPPSVCMRNLIDHDYLTKILTLYRNAEQFAHGQKTY